MSFTFGHKTESLYLIWRASTSGGRHETQRSVRQRCAEGLRKGAQRADRDKRGLQKCRGSMMAAKRTAVLFLEVGLELSRNRFGFFRGSTKALFRLQGCQPWFYRLPPVGPLFFPTTRLMRSSSIIMQMIIVHLYTNVHVRSAQATILLFWQGRNEFRTRDKCVIVSSSAPSSASLVQHYPGTAQNARQ